jgi:hypothetical protein
MNARFNLIGLLLLSVSFCTFADTSTASHQTQGNQTSVNQEETWLYTVQKNDSFERIFQKYLNSRASILALSKYNQHKLTKKLQPNQVISIPVEMLKKIPTSAQVLLAYGDVAATIFSTNITRKVSKGDVLVQGDALQTGKNSLAKLSFADGSTLDVQPNSNLSIQASFKYVGKETYVTHLKLMKGRTEVTANPAHMIGNTLNVETPSAIAAVRGTQFRVGADGDMALQETLEGQVAFSAAENGVVQEVLLHKGYGSVAEKNKAPMQPIMLPAAPDVSVLPTVIATRTADFTLSPQPDAVAWVAQLALDADFTQIVSEQTTKTGHLSFSDLTDGQYFLKLRAQDQHGLQGKNAQHAFTVKFQAPEPILELLLPLDNAVIDLAPTDLTWSPFPNASRYVVQIARDINFTDVVLERHATFNRLSIMQSFGSGQFYWRVGVLSQRKAQNFSEVRKFSR